MEKKIILVGGGGHALFLLEALPRAENVAGYLSLAPSQSMTVEWLGTDSDAPSFKNDHLFHIAFVYAGLPLMKKRRLLIDKFEEMGVGFASIVAPSALVTRNSSVGEGSAVLNNAVINRAHLGRNVVVNTGAIVEHDCVIGSNSFIGPGAVMGGNVKIGENCFIGLGTRIKNGVTITDNISVGMGAIIDRDLTEPGIYHGIPLRFHPVK